MRLGIVVGSPAVISKLAVLKSATTLNNPYEFQALLVALWKSKKEEIRDVSHYLNERNNWVSSASKEYNLPIIESEATHYRLLECGKYVDDIFDFLVKHNIFLARCSENGLPTDLRFNMTAKKAEITHFFKTLSDYYSILS